jgi:hypothetical protein
MYHADGRAQVKSELGADVQVERVGCSDIDGAGHRVNTDRHGEKRFAQAGGEAVYDAKLGANAADGGQVCAERGGMNGRGWHGGISYQGAYEGRARCQVCDQRSLQLLWRRGSGD